MTTFVLFVASWICGVVVFMLQRGWRFGMFFGLSDIQFALGLWIFGLPALMIVFPVLTWMWQRRASSVRTSTLALAGLALGTVSALVALFLFSGAINAYRRGEHNALLLMLDALRSGSISGLLILHCVTGVVFGALLGLTALGRHRRMVARSDT